MSIQESTIINWVRNKAYVILAVIFFSTTLFSLISGSESFGGGLKGILKNIPNTLPWLTLLLLVLGSIKYRKTGSILIIVYGLFLVYFFNFSGPNFFLVTFLITTLVSISGILLLLSHLKRDKKLR